MNRKKYLIAVVTFSILSLILIISQVGQKDKAFAHVFNFESLAEYVKSYKTTTPLETSNLIDEKKYAAQYFFKKHLTGLELTDTEAKKQAYDQVLEETVLFEKAKSENLLATNAQALKMSDEIRSLLKNEPGEHKETIQSVNEVIKGLNITEDQYFSEFLVDSYIISISIDNLYEKVTKDYTQEDKENMWEKFKSFEVNKFVTKNEKNINEFIKTHNIK